ncbi:MAG: ATP-dependent helicase HrpB [Opitutales bacterium]|nr:ATP-dependent helicase HrpB [Opitutales bacterium]
MAGNRKPISPHSRADTADLPIRLIENHLVEALRTSPSLLLRAPTGSGKSTQLPQILHQHGFLDQGEAVILQPRRLPTRLLAKRVASEMGEPVGHTVGYQIRLDNQTTRHTKIRFVTEGLLLRQIIEDPFFEGIDVVVFDEFHERNIYSDVCLALARKAQQTVRPDLKLIVMSATLETGPLEDWLQPCQVIETEDRSYPVDIAYLDPRRARQADRLPDLAAQEVARLLREDNQSGHCLVFMPGAGEIRQTLRALQTLPETRSLPAYPLYGELPPDQQDAALRPSTERKIIVATNVAETSLTIDGVSLVVDSGLARIARYDQARGLNTLLVEKISHSAADQRAGRAGRTGPGQALRLWPQSDHPNRAPSDTPELQRVDLAEILLQLKAYPDRDIPWFEPPPEEAWQRAHQLLHHLGALTPESETLTDIGRTMVRFPLPPRYARLLIAAAELDCLPPIALAAALNQTRDLFLRQTSHRQKQLREDRLEEDSASDLFYRMAAWVYAADNRFDRRVCDEIGLHSQAARQAEQFLRQFLRIAQTHNLWTGPTDLAPSALLPQNEEEKENFRRCLLLGFSDHIAQRVSRGSKRFAVTGNRRGDLDRDSGITADLVVALDLREISGGPPGESRVLLGQVSAIEEEWLGELFPQDLKTLPEVSFDPSTRRVSQQEKTFFRDLCLREKPSGAPSPDAAAEILAGEVLAGRAVLKNWTQEVDQFIARVNSLSSWFPEYEIPSLGEEEIRFVVTGICHGAFSVKEIKDRPVLPAFQDWLPPEQRGALDQLCPPTLALPNGRRRKLRYQNDATPPILSARIQELYDIPGNLTIAEGRSGLSYEILAPNQRPVQITADLAAFWENSYPAIRKELKGRYPKHEWR